MPIKYCHILIYKKKHFQNINEELDLATAAFLEADDGFSINKDKSIIYLSSLFQWYGSDFGKSTSDVLSWISSNLQDKSKKVELDSYLKSGSYKVSYITYDWGSNSSDKWLQHFFYSNNQLFNICEICHTNRVFINNNLIVYNQFILFIKFITN